MGEAVAEPGAAPAEAADLRHVLWWGHPCSSMPSWAQVRAYSKRTGHEQAGPWVQVHAIVSHRATKGWGSTRGWQRAKAEVLFSSWH